MAKVLITLSSLALAALVTIEFAQAGERSGEQIVKQQCASCHQSGAHGAPKIDDRAAWAPRLKNGLDATVRSAINGHGKMPARGGIANVTDTELRAAILYMFYPVGSESRAARPASSPQDPRTRVVSGMEVFLGIAPADAKGLYHVNISLRDVSSNELIKDAVVEARVANPLGGTTKKLDLVDFGGARSYLSDFRMTGKEPYVISVQIRRPNAPSATEVKFEFNP